MKHRQPAGEGSRPTKVERFLHILNDHRWHATKELVRRVGHTFAVAKFKLVTCGYPIEKRHHATKKNQWQYRLLEEPSYEPND